MSAAIEHNGANSIKRRSQYCCEHLLSLDSRPIYDHQIKGAVSPFFVLKLGGIHEE
jgi:hypothetical protein